MAQAELGDCAAGRVDHPPGRGRTTAERLENGLASRRGGLDGGGVGRDSKQPHHVKTPSARARNRIGAPERRQRSTRQNRVHPAVFTGPPRSGQGVVQGNFAVADSPKTVEAPGANGVRLGFSGGVVQFGEFGGSRT